MNQNRRRFLVAAGVTLAATAVPFSARSSDTMKTGIIDSGTVASALGTTWLQAGPEDMLPSRLI